MGDKKVIGIALDADWMTFDQIWTEDPAREERRGERGEAAA